MINDTPAIAINANVEQPDESPQSLAAAQSTYRMADEAIEASAPHQKAFLAALGLIHLQGINLMQVTEDLQKEAPTRYKKLIARFRDLVSSGHSIPMAIDATPGLLPTSSILAIKACEEQQQHQNFYNRILQHTGSHEFSISPRQQMMWRLLRNGFMYFFVFNVFIFISIKILPEMADILEEFGMELPGPLHWLEFINRYFMFGLMAVVLIGAVLSPILIRYLLEALRGWSLHHWKTPLEMEATLKRKSLSSLAIGTHETTLSDTRVKILSASENKAIDQSASLPAQSWLLNYFANQHENRFHQRSMRILNFFISIANILMVLLVFTIALAVFSVLLNIMEELNQW